MLFEVALQQQTGKAPAFLAHAKHFRQAGSVSLAEDEKASHDAFQRILQQADAGMSAVLIFVSLWSVFHAL